MHRGSDNIIDYSIRDNRYPGRHSYGYGFSPVELRKALEPLIIQIKRYDSLRQKLNYDGGRVSDFSKIAEILSRKITFKGSYPSHEIALTDRSALRTMLNDVGYGSLHLDVRLLESQWPVYYLCRIRRDYWSAYSLIVEDIYMSPNYPMTDERFVKLMDVGHEMYYLRLSHFREGVAKMLGKNGKDSQWKVDEILYELGRHVFQAAWHEDQRPGILIAEHFGLRHFQRAIELLYLCLSGELCELRGAVSKQMIRFFEEFYPQPPICTLLKQLTLLDGKELNEIPQKALKLYSRLSRAFSRFLQMEVTWSNRRAVLPLYKLIFGNFYRMKLVAEALRENSEVSRGKEELEKESHIIIDKIMGLLPSS